MRLFSKVRRRETARHADMYPDFFPLDMSNGDLPTTIWGDVGMSIGVTEMRRSMEDAVAAPSWSELSLGTRMRVLLDVMEAERGFRIRFRDVEAHLAAFGVPISRSRWSYLLNGHRDTDDEELLKHLALFFEVAHDALTPECAVSGTLIDRISRVRAVRVERVKAFAARELDGVAPGAAAAVGQALESVLEPH